MVRVNYREGDWFGVPLGDGGYAVGVVARSNPNAALLGYFFGPRRSEVPAIPDITDLAPTDAVLVGTFGHLGLLRGTWPIIGQVPGWDRSRWPMPVFVRFEELTGRWFNVIHDPDDPAKRLREEQIAPARGQPEDGLMGPGFVEERLTRLLSRWH